MIYLLANSAPSRKCIVKVAAMISPVQITEMLTHNNASLSKPRHLVVKTKQLL